MLDLKPHQVRGLAEIWSKVDSGRNAICCTSPTGGGKSLMMRELIRECLVRQWPVVLYTNRRLLLEQTSGGLESEGICFGIRASGYDPELMRDIQLSSIQTEEARCFRKSTWKLHEARLALIDEAHCNSNGTAEKIARSHMDSGAALLGFTATPLGIGHLYEDLVVAGTNSELRECGLHVPARTYAPDEPDLRHVRNYKVGEDLTDKENAKAIMRPGVFGRVYDAWKKLNPEARPTILFGPDVAGSVWFSEQFAKKGVPSAHIDGENIVENGNAVSSTPDAREDLFRRFRSGDIAVVCNRFVLREGIDLPFAYHGIFATVFGSLQSYLQAGGRLLRAHGSLDHVIIQDHGGGWYRHGSLNADRAWDLGLTSHIVSSIREERLRGDSPDKKEEEPIVCPRCGAVRGWGDTCHGCGYKSHRRSRQVVQINGSLKEVEGKIYKPRRITTDPTAKDIWEKLYYRGRNSGGTFRQAEALFMLENGFKYPPRTLPLQPVNELDWYRKIKDVDKATLRQEQTQ